MVLSEIRPGSPEADAAARKILTTLYELAAAAQGAAGLTFTVTRKVKQNAPEGELGSALSAGEGPAGLFGDTNSIAHAGRDCKI